MKSFHLILGIYCGRMIGMIRDWQYSVKVLSRITQQIVSGTFRFSCSPATPNRMHFLDNFDQFGSDSISRPENRKRTWFSIHSVLEIRQIEWCRILEFALHLENCLKCGISFEDVGNDVPSHIAVYILSASVEKKLKRWSSRQEIYWF
jgi:hypothetical protein